MDRGQLEKGKADQHMIRVHLLFVTFSIFEQIVCPEHKRITSFPIFQIISQDVFEVFIYALELQD